MVVAAVGDGVLGKRQTAAVYEQVVLAAQTAPVDRAGAGRGSSGSIRSPNASGTSHGFALIDILPSSTRDADGFRESRAGPCSFS